MPSITISTPTAGSTVARPFNANGTYTSDEEFVSISVVLKDATGAVVAVGSPMDIGVGTWSTTLAPTQGYAGASVHASIDGTTASATEGNITVN